MKQKSKYRVFIVDDHPLVRQGITAVLSTAEDIEPCGEAANAGEALAMIEELKPHAAIVDLTLQRSSGLDLIHDLQIRCPDVKVLVVSMKDEGFYAERVIRAGARGFLSKDCSPNETIVALRKIREGGIYVSENIAMRIISRVASGTQSEGGNKLGTLTDREITILELIGTGLPARRIARRLHISPKTVDSHREHIKSKLNLSDAAALTRFAVEWVSGRGIPAVN